MSSRLLGVTGFLGSGSGLSVWGWALHKEPGVALNLRGLWCVSRPRSKDAPKPCSDQ